jgi:DNA-binding MarR family transcriptional regulator
VTLKATSGRVQARRAPAKLIKKTPAPKPPMPLTVTRPELISHGSDRDFRRLVHGLFGLFSRHEKIRDGHAKFIGLTGIDYTVLISIAHLRAEGDVSVRAVADHLHLSGAFITTVTRRLMELGLIHKEADAYDKRRVSLTVSAKGRALLKRLAPVQRQVNDVEFEGLTAEDFKRLLELIQRLIQSSERAIALQSYLYSRADQDDS